MKDLLAWYLPVTRTQNDLVAINKVTSEAESIGLELVGTASIRHEYKATSQKFPKFGEFSSQPGVITLFLKPTPNFAGQTLDFSMGAIQIPDEFTASLLEASLGSSTATSPDVASNLTKIKQFCINTREALNKLYSTVLLSGSGSSIVSSIYSSIPDESTLETQLGSSSSPNTEAIASLLETLKTAKTQFAEYASTIDSEQDSYSSVQQIEAQFSGLDALTTGVQKPAPEPNKSSVNIQLAQALGSLRTKLKTLSDNIIEGNVTQSTVKATLAELSESLPNVDTADGQDAGNVELSTAARTAKTSLNRLAQNIDEDTSTSTMATAVSSLAGEIPDDAVLIKFKASDEKGDKDPSPNSSGSAEKDELIASLAKTTLSLTKTLRSVTKKLEEEQSDLATRARATKAAENEVLTEVSSIIAGMRDVSDYSIAKLVSKGTGRDAESVLEEIKAGVS